MPSESYAEQLSRLDHVFYLFGYGIQHSLSPFLHEVVFDHFGLNWAYLLFEQKELVPCLQAMRDPKFLGAAVTMPHKVDIVSHLDELTSEGHAIGAINTIFIRKENGRRIICGANTDCIGIREAILRNARPELLAATKSRPAMIIGVGGASRAAVYTLRRFLGFDTIYLVNRDRGETDAVIKECSANGFGSGLVHVQDEGQATLLPVPGLIISAIPDSEPSNIAERTVRSIVEIMLSGAVKGIILEMCYHPSPDTHICRMAKKAAWQVVPGVEAMIWQGIEQDRYWTKREAREMPISDVKTAISKYLSRSLSGSGGSSPYVWLWLSIFGGVMDS
ncbi:hypothetical protein MMC14_000797 [Varicellaria rhodocarpa]|nr:hypothetical protein [Varicellaria rhodocarpa]